MPLEKLFETINSEILTEDVKLQLSTIFEAQVNEAVKAKEEELDEKNRAEIAEFKEGLTNQISEYVDYVVEEFLKENEEAIDSKVKVKTAERVLESFIGVMRQFNVQLSEEKIEIDDMVETLKADNNKLMAKLSESRKELEIVKKAALIAEAAGKLEIDSEKEKLVTIAEGLEFEEDSFSKKLDVIVQQIVESREVPPQSFEKQEDPKDLKEGLDGKKEDDSKASMKQYMKYL
mgnify:CR=1 FL=1